MDESTYEHQDEDENNPIPGYDIDVDDDSGDLLDMQP